MKNVLFGKIDTDRVKFNLNAQDEIKVGDRVTVGGVKNGIVEYIGTIHISPGVWCGIKLDEPVGKNDGQIQGVRYFTCEPKFGVFSSIDRVEKIVKNSKMNRFADRNSSFFPENVNFSNETALVEPKKSSNYDFLQSSFKGAERLQVFDKNQFEEFQREIQLRKNENELLIREKSFLENEIEELRSKLKFVEPTDEIQTKYENLLRTKDEQIEQEKRGFFSLGKTKKKLSVFSFQKLFSVKIESTNFRNSSNKNKTKKKK